MTQNIQQGIPIYIDPNGNIHQSNIIGFTNQPQNISNNQLPQWAHDIAEPTQIQCQFCRKQILTIPKRKIGRGSIICSFILMLTFPILFCLPCFKESCLDVVHICPQCEHVVGRKNYKPCSC